MESRTSFDARTSARATTRQFGPVSGTHQQEGTAVLPQFESEPAGLVEWLGTPEARRLEGRWVLLSDDFEVTNHDHSPSQLLRRNRGVIAPLVVFVDPADNLVV